MLTIQKVRTIRTMIEEGLSQQTIANKFGVGKSTIRGINTRSTWWWIDDIDENDEWLVCELIKDGFSIGDVAEKFDLPVVAIQIIRNTNEVSCNE